MMNMKEALRNRAELALWSGRKAVHQSRLKSLQSKYILEQDDVNRMERGIFSKWKRGYEEKLEKERAEVETAKAEWEKISALIKIADEKLPVLELKARDYEEFWKTADTSTLMGEDKSLFQWCQQAEMCMRLAKEANLCIMKLKEAQQYAFAGPVAYEEVMIRLQGQIDRLWMSAEGFLKDVCNTDRVDKGKHSLAFLEAGKSELARVCRQWSHWEEIGRDLKVHHALCEMEANLNKLREQFGDVFEGLAKDGEELLQRMNGGENHFCEKEMEVQTVTADKEITDIVPEKPVFAGVGLFAPVDLSKEKERVLFGLDLLKKEFGKITPENDRLYGWERALWEWQQDLKQYRKNAGNFSCALDGYEILDKKIWRYSEEDAAELRKVYQAHLQDTAERLEKAEEQIRAHKK